MPPVLVLLGEPLLAADPKPTSSEDAVLTFFADRLHGIQKLRRQLRAITLEVTTRCNLRCRHCYMNATRRSPRGELAFAEICGLAYGIRRDFGTRVPISLTGGEPLARRDIFLILRVMRLLGLTVSLSTNGTWLYPECVARLPGLVSGLSVSLDGLEESHDRLRGRRAWRMALAGLRRVIEAGLPEIVVKTAVHRGNLAELPELHRFVGDQGVSEWHLFSVEPWGRAASMRGGILSPREYGELCDFFDAIKEGSPWACFEEQTTFERSRPAREAGRYARCSAGVSSLAILANGDVVPCVQVGRFGRSVEGNVRDARLLDIWKRGFRRCRAKSWRQCGCHHFG